MNLWKQDLNKNKQNNFKINKLNKGTYTPELYLPKLFNEAKATLHFQNPTQRIIDRSHLNLKF